jgi:release factor glutamine methyltransferase
MIPRVPVDRRAAPCTLGFFMEDVQRQLEAGGIETADREARWLIEHALGLNRSSQLVDRARPVEATAVTTLNALVARRIAREPLQYILGTQEFCGLEFEVNPNVLIPRPETELLVQELIRRLPQSAQPTIIDIGTGSGCLAVTIARAVPSATIFATDLSGQALETAKRNARRHGVEANIVWLEGDLLAPIADACREGTVTAVVSNPPYIPESEWSGLQPEVGRYEPRMALVAGPRGTEVHERLLVGAAAFLVRGGFLVMELGQGQSAQLCSKIKTLPQYERAEVVPDEAGIDRIIIVQRVG